MASPAAGQVIGGRFRLEFCLGDGGFGEVWRAIDIRLEPRLVAIKFLKTAVHTSPAIIERFGMEAKTLSVLSHPNIVSIVDRGEESGFHYIVMEYLNGKILAAWLDDYRVLGESPDPGVVLAIFDKIAAAIEAAHEVRQPGPILHRDLKPANVFLVHHAHSDELFVKVVDFGLAQLGGRLVTPTGAVMGTPAYMAPEQALGAAAAISRATDVFSMGIVLIELLTLEMQPPSQAPWWVEVVRGQTPDPSLLNRMKPDLPVAFWNVVMRALSNRPEDRYQSAGEFRRAVRPLRQDVLKIFRQTPRVSLGNIDRLRLLEQEVDRCKKCRLGSLRKMPAFSRGSVPAKVMFIGEGPGAEDDRTGIPFAGPAGQLLDRMIAAMELSIEDVYITNVVKCGTPGSMTPEAGDVSSCSQYWKQQVEIVSPKIIVTLGKVATQEVLGSDFQLSALRGKWQTYEDTLVMPTHHPSHLLRVPQDKIDSWEHMKKVMQALGEMRQLGL